MASRLAVAALFASPLSNVLLTWLGQPDPIIVGLGALLSVSTSPAAVGLAAFTLALTHTEQAIAIVVVLLAARYVVGDLGGRQAFALIAGLFAGALAVTVFKHHFGMGESRFAYAEGVGLGEFARNFFTNWHIVLIASFGAAWVLVVLLACNLDRLQRATFAAVVTGGFAVAFLTLDTTRVFALVTFPAVLVLVGYSVRTIPERALQRVLAMTLVAGALYPHIVVWEGHTYVSSLSRTIDWFTG
jgi:hypothetical protein